MIPWKPVKVDRNPDGSPKLIEFNFEGIIIGFRGPGSKNESYRYRESQLCVRSEMQIPKPIYKRIINVTWGIYSQHLRRQRQLELNLTGGSK